MIELTFKSTAPIGGFEEDEDAYEEEDPSESDEENMYKTTPLIFSNAPFQ